MDRNRKQLTRTTVVAAAVITAGLTVVIAANRVARADLDPASCRLCRDGRGPIWRARRCDPGLRCLPGRSWYSLGSSRPRPSNHRAEGCPGTRCPIYDSTALATGGERNDRDLRDLDPRARHRRLPDRHYEARQTMSSGRNSAQMCSRTRTVRARASSSCLDGAGGAAGGADIPINIPAGTSRVTFVWDQVSHIVTHKLNN